MTTITRERLKQIYAECEERDPAIFEIRELVRIALASLEAKPVAWECGENIILFNPDTVEAYAKRAEISPKPLYTAPPAQIVSIPDDWRTCEKLSDDNCVDNALRELVEDTTGDNGVRVVQAVIRAFRDSGLIHTYPDLSQPVDPQVSEYEKIMLQVGWVMVPVEPTDEMIAAALDSHLIVFNPVKTYSVMLAAAPQPEALDGK